jgi:hypothetical protein
MGMRNNPEAMKRKLAAHYYDARVPDLYNADGALDIVGAMAARAADADVDADRAVVRAYLREIRLKASEMNLEIVGEVQIKFNGRIYR